MKLAYAPPEELGRPDVRHVVASCAVLVLTLEPRDRLNAVAAVARLWTDVAEFRDRPAVEPPAWMPVP